VHDGDARLTGALLIMAMGVAPRSELASAAGLETDEGAIPVDASMQSRIPGVRAAGDVCAAMNQAAGRRLRVEHWGDALGQGEIAGAAAAGLDVAWDEVPGFWSTIGRHTLKYAAWGDGFDNVRFEPSPSGAFAAWYTRADRLVGVLTHDLDEAYEQGRDDVAGGVAWTV
jgi:3-phenylpropionate/trans-cinnamate dioxygenase ferredoxin reductase component